MTLLKDAIDQAKPFFLIPKIQKEGQDFLETKDSKASLKLILNYLTEQKIIKLDKEIAKEIINEISKKHNVKKGILMKSLRVAFFGSLSGPDLIQSWELFAESKTDITLLKDVFNQSKLFFWHNSSLFAKGLAESPCIPTVIKIVRKTKP